MEIQPAASLFPTTAPGSQQSSGQGGINSFKHLLDQALNSVDTLQKQAEQAAESVAAGNASNFHDAIIASQKASLALMLTAQIQNKIVEAYNTMMQMQL